MRDAWKRIKRMGLSLHKEIGETSDNSLAMCGNHLLSIAQGKDCVRKSVIFQPT